MKAMRFLSTTLVFCLVLMLGQSYAQNAGIAADKQKQANLDKINKHQAELKKKYDAMTPEQAAAARQKADEYKRSGGKVHPAGSSNKANTPTKKTNGSPVINKTTAQKKQGNVKKSTTSGKPVWMDEKGKAKTKVTPVSNPQGKSDSKPSTVGKIKHTPVNKQAVKSTQVVKTPVPAQKIDAVEKGKK